MIATAVSRVIFWHMTPCRLCIDSNFWKVIAASFFVVKNGGGRFPLNSTTHHPVYKYMLSYP
jgi:hypothetical protein